MQRELPHQWVSSLLACAVNSYVPFLFSLVYTGSLHMKGFIMRTKLPENDVPIALRLPDEAEYETAVSEIIDGLSDGWRVSGKPTALPETEDWLPPSRPLRGCEDC